MRNRALSLRSILSTTTTGILVLSLLVAGTLVTLSTILHRTTSSAVRSVDSVWLAQQAQIELLLHERTPDPFLQLEFERRIRSRLDKARRLIDSAGEVVLVSDAIGRLEEYSAATTDANKRARRGELDRSLDALAAFNVAEARQAELSATFWDHVGNVAGLGVAGLLLVVTGALIFWLRRTAFVPMLSLADTIKRFETGDHAARAAERGPAEVRDMSRRFNKLAEALGAQRRAQVAFLAGVAHDLRNPLALLKLSLDVFDVETTLPPEPVLRRVLPKVQRQVIQLERMVGDFLEVAKSETSELALVIETHDLRTVVHDSVDLFADSIPAQRLHVELPERPVPVRCDALRLEQVVTNLISNAVKYSAPDTPIDVAIDVALGDVVLRVTDRGAGLSDDEKQVIFEPFRRAGLTSHIVPGVGLGLSVVRRIVTAHGGRIEIDSAPGAGSTFRVVLHRDGPDRDEAAMSSSRTMAR